MPFVAAILGIAISIVFIALAFAPSSPAFDQPPAIRAVLLVFGVPMLILAVLALRHALRARAIMRAAPQGYATVRIEVDESSDTTSYTAVATIGSETWAVPVYGGRGVGRLVKAGESEVPVWRDPATGAPVGFSAKGHRVTTYPKAIRRQVDR